MDITVETTISRVTVYPDRARVTCQGVCQTPAGIHRLLIEELSLFLEPDSIRVAGQGTARVRLLGVDVVNRYYTETPAEKVRQLEQQIEQLEDELRALEDSKAGWAAQAKYLDGLRQASTEYAKGLSRGRMTIEEQNRLIAFMQEQDRAMRTAVRQLEQQQRELNRRLQKLRQELKELHAARPRQRYAAYVEIEVLSEGDFQPEVSYVVHNAGWQPLYDIRLLETAEGNGQRQTVEVDYIAQVTQNTGQDWPGVQLIVSTARPALNQLLPELQPWFLDVYTPPPPMPLAPARAMAMSAPMAAKAAFQETAAVAEVALDMVEAEVAVADVQATGTTVSFAIPGGTDIPSDGSPHKTTINRFNLDPKVDYLAVPRHTDAVYRRATVTNNSPGPLLAGSASLFVGDEFIGRTQLEYTPSAGEIKLLLGVEERITIKRELDKREVDKRLLRDIRQLRYGYKIEVKNLLPQAAMVEVHDHIPVARHEQIKVKLEQARPEPAEKSDLNLLEWHLALAAGQEQTIRYEYTVEYARSLQIVGLSD
jgi:uncharacterized protein (TIGR02231 family)